MRFEGLAGYRMPWFSACLRGFLIPAIRDHPCQAENLIPETSRDANPMPVHVKLGCWLAFILIGGAFLYAWRWFIFIHQASFVEFALAMVALVAIGCAVERLSFRRAMRFPRRFPTKP